MTTDKELLELAAKVAGYDFNWYCRGANNPNGVPDVPCVNGSEWKPLTDDGDALRLAVKLSLTVDIGIDKYTECQWLDSDIEIQEWFNGDPYAATRRAIVRAAAEIGRTM